MYCENILQHRGEFDRLVSTRKYRNVYEVLVRTI